MCLIKKTLMKKFATKNNLNLNELKNKIKIKNKEYIKNPL